MDENVVAGSSNVTTKVKKPKKSLGRQCAAFNCNNTFYKSDGSKSGTHFFKFPQTNPKKNRWCNLIKRQDGKDDFKVSNNTFVCQHHFKESDIKKNPNAWRLKMDVEPSTNLYQSFDNPPSTSRKSPRKRLVFSTSTSTTCTSTDNLSPLPLLTDMDISTNVFSGNDVGTQTSFSFVSSPVYLDPTPFEIDVARDHGYSTSSLTNNVLINICSEHNNFKIEMEKSETMIKKLKENISNLEAEIDNYRSREFTFDKIKEDPAAVKFYTGFPNASSLESVLEYFETKLVNMQYWTGPKTLEKPDTSYLGSSKPGRKRSLSRKQEFFIVLLRLKVGLFVNDIADRFNISPGHVSKIFTTWINFLYHELPLLFPFPSQAMIRMYMPAEFKDFPTTRIIIDGTEIFCQVPSSLKSQSQTWSDYKHHNTWKALIGISPNGCITFVSKLWSGRVSDRQQTKDCGVLDLLEPGDNIMADRGYNIQDLLPAGVNLNLPPYKGQRDQLTAEEAEETAKIASVRIHVERAIGRVKNYHILNGVMPLAVSPVIDQIFTVCCYLTNFLPPLCAPPST